MPDTRILDVTSGDIESLAAEAARTLKRGGLVAFPTETVYGLGADAFDEAAVVKVFRAKARPSANPLIVHINDLRQLTDIARSVTKHAQTLARAFWPGPLTLVVEHRRQIPDAVTAGLP